MADDNKSELEYLVEDIRTKYSTSEDIHSWKLESDMITTPEMMLQSWQSLKAQGILPSFESDLIFVSPTANYPTHEVAIYKNEITERQGKILFLVGDISDVNPSPLLHENQIQNNQYQQFHYFKWNANALPISNQSVDVIWDRKGWLWHLAENAKFLSEGEGRQMVLSAFDQYFQLLSNKGVLIVDATTSTQQAEISTVQLLSDLFKDDKGDILGDRFDIIDISDGKQKFRVFRLKLARL